MADKKKEQKSENKKSSSKTKKKQTNKKAKDTSLEDKLKKEDTPPKGQSDNVPEIKASEKEESPTEIISDKVDEHVEYNDREAGGDQVIVVAMGASAGGLKAFEQFFKNMPSDSGLAFALIQHMDPSHKSYMPELVSRFTDMAVKQVEDGMKVERNTVYVIPPNRYMGIMTGYLHLLAPTHKSGPPAPIDFFFKSMAEDLKEKSICIVFSGTGSEGALGLRAIKGAGGVGMVQNPDSAEYDGMPLNAMKTGLVDYALAAEAMPERLLEYVKYAFEKPRKKIPRKDSEKELLQKIYLLVKTQTGHDFSQYKKTTILRRIERRMAVHRIDELEDYLRRIQENPREADQLHKELLIGVTSFFRDIEAFEALKEIVLPGIFKDRTPGMPIRVWVPGTSTGEEAYSLAILIRDYMDRQGKDNQVQIFATDIDMDAIEYSRQGIYPQSIAPDVPGDYLERYFTPKDSHYQINRRVREMVVFAPQNIISDPPFSHIDLISCRNLLIYLESELQNRILWIFHYALVPQGFLFLGSSESIGRRHEEFSVRDRKWKIFQQMEGKSSRNLSNEVSLPIAFDEYKRPEVGQPRLYEDRDRPREVTERTIVERYGPPALVINQSNEVIFVHGSAGKFIHPPNGEFTVNVLEIIQRDLKLALANTIRRATVQESEVKTENIFTTVDGQSCIMDIIGVPINHPGDMSGSLIIFFEKKPSVSQLSAREDSPGSEQEESRIEQLENELSSNKEYLQTTIEELETSNEELQSSNEELHTTNEELQSTNEELETSKEEAQSVNEELRTVNVELEQKIDELSKTSSDLSNLLASTDIGMVFLDSDMRIRRFTPKISDFINLIDSDIGRPINHLATKLKYDGLVSDSKEVLNKLQSREIEIQTDNGNWYLTRIIPYRTLENYIDGVVITFIDITTQKRIEHELAKMSNVFMESVDPIIIETVEGTVDKINNESENIYGWRAEELKEKPGDTIIHPDYRDRMAKYRKRALKGEKIRHMEVVRINRKGDIIKTHTNIFSLNDEAGKVEGIAMIDRRQEE